jgi:hypothetical protein
MNEKTLADLSLKLSKALCAMNSCDCQECEEKWGRVVAAFAELDAALARPPADSELDRLRMREPRREEMEAALGEANEAFYEGWTIRRCRHCRIPVAGGPTACEVCAATQDPDKNPWPPPKVAGAVGRLVEHLNANADDFNRWPMEMKSLIAAAVAERAGEREVKLDVVGTSELVFGAGKWSAYRLVGPHALCIRAALGLVDADTGTSLPLAIRRLDPQGPRAKRPWRLKTGRMICAECQQDVPPKWLMCDNGDCPQYGKPWGKPRDLPSGEEVGE